jgi:hypothetical protein
MKEKSSEHLPGFEHGILSPSLLIDLSISLMLYQFNMKLDKLQYHGHEYRNPQSTCRESKMECCVSHTSLNYQLCLLPAWPILRPWRWGRQVPPKCSLTLNGLHGVISQNTGLFDPSVRLLLHLSGLSHTHTSKYAGKCHVTIVRTL